ncbi:BPS1-LIKE PROTEIN [Salix koriyanagi]|uniref:BPS1-LIKE PROTEIN n=1 Tax=Salix koriyanagi TaxID=2511006 RepID=A0A9Q0TSJ6_9ROSI|nr:BPS1-LIKE PROTEIN [Salix koriyanagi]
MAASPNQKTGFHPFRPNPIITQLDEHLCRSRASEGASTSSSLGGKLNSLQDLHDCVNKLLLLPLNQQAIAQENTGKLIDELLDGSLQVLDLCNTAKDALLQTKESIHEFQSILRRRCCGETVSKLVHHKKVAPADEEADINEFAKADAALSALVDQNTRKSDNIKGVQTQLQNLELFAQDIEGGLEHLSRNLIKTRGESGIIQQSYQSLPGDTEANDADLSERFRGHLYIIIINRSQTKWPSGFRDLSGSWMRATLPRDALLQSKEYIRELQSVIRRRQGGVDGEIRKYMASRKVVKKSIKKALKNMKSAGNKCTFSNEDPEISMLREVESISLALFESLLSFISEPKSQAKKSGWSLVSKLINHHGIACEEEETKVNEFAMADSALQSLISCKTDTMMGVQKKLSNLELCIEDLEDGIDGLFRRMIKNRASFLNIFS